VDPIALPPRSTQTRMDGLSVIAALRTDEYGKLGKRGDVMGVEHPGIVRRGGTGTGSGGTGLRGAEKRRCDEVEVLLLAHSVEKHRTDHAAPTDDADVFHMSMINSAAGGRRL